ncbi:MAG: hypothetical protein KDK70_11245 [Myxococcales bacterium]|nr:hypothetical protein [Myxococcales bacterium]
MHDIVRDAAASQVSGPTTPEHPRPELERARREHIHTETSVKTAGVLLYLAGAAAAIVALVSMKDGNVGLGVLQIAVGIGGMVAARWLLRLDARGRLLYSVIAVIVLGNLLYVNTAGAYTSGRFLGRLLWPTAVLIALWTSKATFVMTQHYRDVVIPATPDVRRSLSKSFVVLVSIFVTLLAFVP